MPAMPRMNNRLKKIAFKIVGIPANMRPVNKKQWDKANQRLVFEETSRVR